MAAIIIRNLPEAVHKALRRIAAERSISVEALVRDTLNEFAARKRSGIHFEKLSRDRAALGLHEDGPGWTPDLDDPALSRRVLGLSPPRRKRKAKK
jgi:plasmid stability protein